MKGNAKVQKVKEKNCKYSVKIYFSKYKDNLYDPLGITVEKHHLRPDNLLHITHPEWADLNTKILNRLAEVQKEIDALPEGSTTEDLRMVLYPEKYQITSTVVSPRSIPVHKLGLIDAFDILIYDATPVEAGGSGKKDVKKGILDVYLSVKNVLLGFEEYAKKSKGKVKCDWYDWEWIEDGLFDTFCEYRWEICDVTNNTVGKDIKTVKTAINHIKDNYKKYNLTVSTKNLKTLTEKIEVIALFPDELSLLADFPIPAEKKHLELVRDLYVFGCFTMFRISDFFTLKKTDIEKKIGKKWSIKRETGKTGVDVEIPLDAQAVEIIERYEKQTENSELLLPTLSEGYYNRAIKEVISEFGIWIAEEEKKGNYTDYDVRYFSATYKKVRHKGDKKVAKTVDFSSMFTSHCQRRTGITSLLINGLSERKIKLLSGHTETSTSFQKYVAISEKYMRDDVESAWGKLRRVKTVQ